MTAAVKDAQKAALRLASRAEQCYAGLSQKLRARGFSREESLEAAQSLIDSGLLDDERYARLWAAARLRRRAASPRSLELSLRMRGVDPSCARAAVEEAVRNAGEELVLARFIEKASSCGRPPSRSSLRVEGFSALCIDSAM